MKSRLTGFLAVTLTVTVASCAVSRDLPICKAPDQVASTPDFSAITPRNISLAGGRYDPPLSVFDDEIYNRNMRPQRSTPVILRNPVSGTALGALGGMGFCGYASAFPPLALACLPVGAVVGAVAGGVAGTIGMTEDASSQGQKQIARERSFDEQTADRKAAQQRVATAVGQVDLNRKLIDQIMLNARESGISDLTELTSQGPVSQDDLPQYRTNTNYVLEVVLTERTVHASGLNISPHFSLGFSARGRIVRVADKKVLHTFTTHESTKSKSGEQWATDNGALLIAELNNALQRIAKTAAEQWLRPPVNTANDASATLVIYRSNADSWESRAISVDGCIVGKFANGEFITVKTSAGKHVVKTERLLLDPWSHQGGSKYLDLNVEVKPGQTCYIESLIRRGRGVEHLLTQRNCQEGEGDPRVRARLLGNLKEHGQETTDAVPARR